MTSSHSLPVWSATRSVPAQPLPPLDAAQRVDVCIVGAGIAGLSTAMSLIERGRSVLVLDREGVAAGESMRTSAHLASALDDRYSELEHWFGEGGARIAATSHAAAIDLVERWCSELAIDCGFRRVPGYLFLDPASTIDVLTDERDAARSAGLDVEFLSSGAPGLGRCGPALRFGDQARFHPLDYLHGLAAGVVAKGGRIMQAEVATIEGGDAPRVRTSTGIEVRADAIVVATNVPFHHRVVMHTKQAAYRTYVIAAAVPKGSVEDALYWDTGDPYHYLRLLEGNAEDLLLIGGEDCKTGQAYDHERNAFGELASWSRQVLADVGEVRFQWSGQVLEPVDALGFVGADPTQANVYLVTGDSGNGLTHGTLAGPLISGLIVDGEHPWQHVYAPDRRRLTGAWLAENSNVVVQYRDWLLAGNVQSARQIKPGDGKIIRHGLHRFAIHRDDDSRLHAFSAKCPHLGCAVRWNGLERSWDCPCHGSRFDGVDGRVLNGPALSGLQPVDLSSDAGNDEAGESLRPTG